VSRAGSRGIAVASQTGQLSHFRVVTPIWDANTGKPVGEPLHHEGRVNAASFSADGARIVTGGSLSPDGKEWRSPKQRKFLFQGDALVLSMARRKWPIFGNWSRWW